MRRLTLSVGLLFATLAAPPAFEVLGPLEFIGDWDDSRNFSGTARVGSVLLVASDEIGRLQTGIMDSAFRVTRGADIVLQHEPGKDVELDIEALAIEGSTVYALGSHSRTRSSSDDPARTASKNHERLEQGAKQRPERDVLVRFTYDAATRQASGIARASLREAIAKHPVLAPFAALAGKENGIDLEGLAVDGSTLFAGFRGPVLRHGFVPVLRFTFDEPTAGKVLYVPLDGHGIRDIAKVSDGFLLLAGPVGDSDAPHRIYLWNGRDCIPGKGAGGGALRLLGDVPAPSRGKAEALLVTVDAAAHYEVALLFDSLEKGGAMRYRLSKKADFTTPSTALCSRQAS
jgi:hypothetical protein